MHDGQPDFPYGKPGWRHTIDAAPKEPAESNKSDKSYSSAAKRTPLQEVVHSQIERLDAPVAPDVPAFPIDALLSPTLIAFVQDGAKALGVPVDLVAVPLFAVLSAAVGNARAAQVTSTWIEKPIIWTGVVAAPGSGKTPAEELAVAPLARKDHDQIIEHETAMSTYRDDLADWEDNEKHGTRPRPPASCSRLVIGNTTSERLVDHLRQNSRGPLEERDELTGLILGLNQYKSGAGSDRTDMLSLWTGKPIRHERKSGDIYAPTPYLAICGGIQPDMVPLLRNRLGDDGMTESVF